MAETMPEMRAAFCPDAVQGTGSTQLLLDLSVLVTTDERSGVQRLVRNVARSLLRHPPEGLRVAAIYDAGGYYAYANAFVHGEDSGLEDDPIEVAPGDIFLGLDLCPNHVPGKRALLLSLRRHGVRMAFVVYDLLPVRQSQHFIAGAAPWFETWLDTVGGVADGLVCISRAVADDLLDWLDEHAPANPGRLQVGYFPLGADLDAAAPQQPISESEQDALARIAGGQSLLMVGTLEPRKMHGQALEAFELLWQQGSDAKLVIVGRQGWMVDALADKVRRHPELGQRLFWLEGASDAALLALYGQCSGLLAASSGEGFGLPLIEAAQHNLPVVARNLPVFREVAGDHAWYFDAEDAKELSAALADWLKLQLEGRAPQSGGMCWIGWDESARRLVQTIVENRWYRQGATRLARPTPLPV